MKQAGLARTLTLAAIVMLAACDDDPGGGRDAPIGVLNNAHAVTPLVSNTVAIPAAQNDPRLVNPWGLAFGPDVAWIANAGSNTATAYSGDGLAAAPAVSIPGGSRGAAGPAGLVFNPVATDFNVTANGVTAPATFIFAGTGGTIAAWSVASGFGGAAVTVHDGGAEDAAYTGLALLNIGGSAFLYAADFHNAEIDTFDNAFSQVVPAGGFIDPDLPAGFAPFNIQVIAGQLVVTYARQAPGADEQEPGAGLGYVSLFDGEGRFIRRLVSQGALNAPWGVALAPAGFGPLSNALLVGNSGDGRINAYNFTTGAFIDTLRNAAGAPVVQDGLRALAFGNGVGTLATNSLFFTAGSNAEADGTFGRIDVTAPTGGAPGLNVTNVATGPLTDDTGTVVDGIRDRSNTSPLPTFTDLTGVDTGIGTDTGSDVGTGTGFGTGTIGTGTGIGIGIGSGTGTGIGVGTDTGTTTGTGTPTGTDTGAGTGTVTTGDTTVTSGNDTSGLIVGGILIEGS